MKRHALSITLAILVASGLCFAQAERSAPERSTAEKTAESVKNAAAKAADEVSEALEKTGKSVKETLGLVKTGCLTQGDEADPFLFADKESGDQITVVGSAELPKHVGHTVTIHGSKESDGRVFHVTQIEHVAASCETPGGRGQSSDGYRGEARKDIDSSEADARGVTADDQGFSAADRKTTQAIRKAVTADESLSLYAQNVKIITRGGLVTLRGPVKTAEEKRAIEAKAAAVAGATNVTNELTVESGGSAQ